MTIEEILHNLEEPNRQAFSTNLDGYHGQLIVQKARELGFRDRESHSECQVASYERHLGKAGWCLDVIQSNFLGSFTDVNLYHSP